MAQQTIHINYKRAKFGRRILANIVDFILFVVTAILLFLATRSIIVTTPHYNEVFTNMNTIRMESGLYVQVEDDIIDVIHYVTAFDHADSDKVYKTKRAIKDFVTYMEDHADKPETVINLKNDLREAAFNPKMVNDEGIPYFAEIDGKIVNNPDCKKVSVISKFNNFYRPVFDDICLSYLVTGVPFYHDYTQYMSNILFFIEIPIAYLTAGILIYYVPTLFFRKGRKTLGRAMYQIGLVDKRLLNPSFGRSSAHFGIFFFAELILTPFTLGIPLFITFSMMVFSKDKQSFPEYMLGLYEVDTSDNKIFNSYDEITLDNIKHDKTPVDFQMRRME